MHICIYMYKYMYIYTHIHIYIHIYIYTYTYIYKHVFIYLYTHTHIFKHMIYEFPGTHRVHIRCVQLWTCWSWRSVPSRGIDTYERECHIVWLLLMHSDGASAPLPPVNSNPIVRVPINCMSLRNLFRCVALDWWQPTRAMNLTRGGALDSKIMTVSLLRGTLLQESCLVIHIDNGERDVPRYVWPFFLSLVYHEPHRPCPTHTVWWQ